MVIDAINWFNLEKINDELLQWLISSIINIFLNQNINNEKEFKNKLKEFLTNYLFNLEEFSWVKEEVKIEWQKRIDLAFNLLNFQYWIELKYWITSSSIRTLEYQINEYQNNITYKNIIIFVKLKNINEINKLNNIWWLIERLSKNEKVLLFFIK